MSSAEIIIPHAKHLLSFPCIVKEGLISLYEYSYPEAWIFLNLIE